MIFHIADTIGHEIHADPSTYHEGGSLAAGSDYIISPTQDMDWYCHDHEGGADARNITVD